MKTWKCSKRVSKSDLCNSGMEGIRFVWGKIVGMGNTPMMGTGLG